jgi:hypothetical protein
MGCCPTSNTYKKDKHNIVIDPSKVNEVKARLKAEKLGASQTTMSTETK